MGISRKKWGYLEWFDEDLNPGVNVGIVVMNPGSHHAPHKHYDEQILYVLQGQAISIVDGIETSISAGSRFHWKAGITHEVYNIGNVPFMHLLVSIPNELNRNRKEYFENLKDSSFTIQLNEVIDQLRSQLLNQVNFPYAIFDSEGRYIIGGPCSNHYCEKKCNRSMLQEFCSCMKYEHPEDIQKEKEFICPYHLNIINIPIFVNQVFLGAVQGGYYWTSDSTYRTCFKWN